MNTKWRESILCFIGLHKWDGGFVHYRKSIYETRIGTYAFRMHMCLNCAEIKEAML